MIVDEHGKPIDKAGEVLREMLSRMPTFEHFTERSTELEANLRVADLRKSCGVKPVGVLRFRRYTKVPLIEDLTDGEPCGHPGCLNHLTHPCEGCGRTAGQKKEPRP